MELKKNYSGDEKCQNLLLSEIKKYCLFYSHRTYQSSNCTYNNENRTVPYALASYTQMQQQDC